MTEFKQIIGRGTRIREDYGKFYFTIIDFKKATELFADPDFDGDPVQIYTPAHPEDSPVPPDLAGPDTSGESVDYPGPQDEDDEVVGEGETVRRYVVSNVQVKVVAERVQYFDADGKLITESLRDYTRRTLLQEFSSLDGFLRRWSSAEKKQAIIEELAEEGVFFDALADEIGRDCDPFDLICHVAWDKPPLTRRERAEEVRKHDYFTKYGEQSRRVIEALLDKYADEGIKDIEETKILTISPFTELGTPLEIVRSFGGKKKYQQALHELEEMLYSA